MSSILLLIFIIALITIVIGLFLSRFPVRHSQNEYLVTAKGRRIVDAPSGRLAERERAGLLRRKTSGERTSSLQVKRRSNIQRTTALVVNPGRLKRRIEESRLRNYLILGLITVFIAALYL